MAGVAIMPAVFASGQDPAAGPGLLFITLQTVFSAMGSLGPVFGTLFLWTCIHSSNNFIHIAR